MSAQRSKRRRVKMPGDDAVTLSQVDVGDARRAAPAFSLPQESAASLHKTRPLTTAPSSGAMRSAPSTPAPAEAPTASLEDKAGNPMEADAGDAAPASPMSPSLVSVRSPAVPTTPVVLAPPALPLHADSAAAQLVALFDSITSDKERREALRRLIQRCPAHDFVYISSLIQPFLRRDFIADLPPEVATHILSYLDARSLCRAARVSSAWRRAAFDENVWRALVRRHGYDTPHPRAVCSTGTPLYRHHFRDRHTLERNWFEGRCTTHVLDRETQGTVTCLALDKDYIFTAGIDAVVKVWSSTRYRVLHNMRGHRGGVWALQYNNGWLVSGATDRSLRVWNLETGQSTAELIGHTSTVRCLQIAGDLLVSGSRDKTLRIWDLRTGECLHTLQGHTESVRCVEVHGDVIVSGSYDGTVRSWNLRTGAPIACMTGHTDKIYCVAYDGVRAASGSQDRTVRVWDVMTGRCLHVLEGHQNLVALVQLRGNTLVSGNAVADHTIHVWDVETGRLRFNFDQDRREGNAHTGSVTCLQFDDTKLFTGGDDGCLKMWDMRTGRFVRDVVTKRAGSNDVVWRLQFDETKLVTAYQSQVESQPERSTVVVMDFDVEGTFAPASDA